MSKYPHLLQPIKVGNTVLKNRIISLPTGLISESNGDPFPSEEAIEHFANRARGGAAMVTTAGAAYVPSKDDRKSWNWDLFDASHLHPLGHLVHYIHALGAKVSVELMNNSLPITDYTVCDGIPLADGTLGKQMPEEEMHRLAECFATAAAGAKEAGMDSICLHYGHGWLISQFLSPLANKRTDEYGGSLENRAKFPIMILDAIRAKVGKDLLIEIRVSGSELEDGGLTLEDCIDFVEMIQDRIDLVHVSAGIHNPKWMTVMHPCGFQEENPLLYLAEAFKKSGKIRIPIVALGGFQDLNVAEQVIADGKADIIGIARGFIADNELGIKAYEDRGEDVRPCIRCMRCHDSTVFEHQLVCSVNPIVGMESKINNIYKPVKKVCNCAVIGGGPAGMEAALTLASRGHKVVLYEANEHLGGNICFADYVSFKYPLSKFKNYLITQIQKSNIDVRLNSYATPEIIQKCNYDAVIIALGAEPIKPNITGIDSSSIAFAADIYDGRQHLGNSVIIIGGGQIGCETAIYLAQLGKEVTLLQDKSDIAIDASRTHRLEILNEMKKEDKIKVITGAIVTEVTEKSADYNILVPKDAGLNTTSLEMTYGSIKIGNKDVSTANIVPLVDSGKSASVKADSVLFATGLRPRLDESLEFYGTANKVIAVGDCLKARNVEPAVREAFYAALSI